MQKRIAILLSIGLSLTFTSANAQSFFGSQNKPANNSATPAMNGKTKVLSEDEFNAEVKKLSKESKDQLKGQIRQEIQAAPPPPPTKVYRAADDKEDGQNRQPDTMGSQPSRPSSSSQRPPQSRPVTSQPSSAAPPANTQQQPSQTRPSSPSSYTGFGSGSSNESGSSSGGSNQSGSGWNINY